MNMARAKMISLQFIQSNQLDLNTFVDKRNENIDRSKVYDETNNVVGFNRNGRIITPLSQARLSFNNQDNNYHLVDSY